MFARLFEWIELWLRHHAEREPYTVHCYYCNANITAPTNEIVEAIQSHQRHPAHRAAEKRSQ